MMTTPAPHPTLPRPSRRSPLDDLDDVVNGMRDDIARMEALLAPREARERDRGEAKTQ